MQQQKSYLTELREKVLAALIVGKTSFSLLKEAIAVFGQGNVSTHVIVGLGETEKEAAQIVQRCVDMGVLPALFAFTPVRGTALEDNSPPKLESYRRIQLARYLISNTKSRVEDMQFDVKGKIIDYGLSNEVLEPIIESGVPFQTSGCPDCNRPYYNEKPSGPIYNYPKKLNKEEIKKIKKELSYKLVSSLLRRLLDGFRQLRFLSCHLLN